jgi:hypothetical protein
MALRTRVVAQVVEHLASKLEALPSIPTMEIKNKDIGNTS